MGWVRGSNWPRGFGAVFVVGKAVGILALLLVMRIALEV